MNKLFTVGALALMSMAASVSVNAEDWYLSGTFNDNGNLQFKANDDGCYSVGVNRLTSGFYIHNADESVSYGGTGRVNVNEGDPYQLVENGDALQLPKGVKAVENASLTFDPKNATLIILGQLEQEGVLYVAGSFNDWNLSDANAVLTREPGTQIYSGRVDMYVRDVATVEWRIYSSSEDVNKNCWGLAAASSDDAQLEGTLVLDALNPVISAPEEYDITFNTATNYFSLTKVVDPDEKKIVIVPNPDEISNMYNQYVVTFEGYVSVRVDASMYDPKKAPGTFKNMQTGEVVSMVGAMPDPYVSNTVTLVHGQTIFNKDYIEEHGVEGNEDYTGLDYDNGSYILTIPEGVIMLDDGTGEVPNAEFSFVYVLGNTFTGIETLAPEYEGMDLYTLDGVLKVRDASASDINSLPRGIYVAKGRKILVK